MSRQLHALIHALTPSEKRYFRVFSERHVIGGQNLYERLFDALLQQEHYDESALRSFFAGEKCLDQFASFKSYLQKNILRSIRNYKGSNPDHNRLEDILQDIEWLLGRGQLDVCGRLIRKGQKLADKYADLGKSLQFLGWERKYIKKTLPKTAQIRLAEIGIKERELLQAMRQEQSMVDLSDQLFWLSQKTLARTPAGKVQELIGEAEMPESDEGLSFYARIGYYSIRAMSAFHLRDMQAAGTAFGEVVRCWQSRPWLIGFQVARYTNALSNFLSCHYEMEDPTAFQNALELARGTTGLGDRDLMAVQIKTLNLELLYYLNRKRLEDAFRIVPKIEEILHASPGLTDDASEVVYRYNMGVVCFVGGDYQAANRHWVRILSFAPREIRIDIRQAALVLQWIGHLEMGEVEMFERSMDGLRQRLRQEGNVDGFLRVHRALQKAPNYRPDETVVRELLTELEKQPVLGTVELGTWLKKMVGDKM